MIIKLFPLALLATIFAVASVDAGVVPEQAVLWQAGDDVNMLQENIKRLIQERFREVPQNSNVVDGIPAKSINAFHQYLVSHNAFAPGSPPLTGEQFNRFYDGYQGAFQAKFEYLQGRSSASRREK